MTTELTFQSVFDQTVTHLFKQGRPSMGVTGACYYRHPADPSLKCAAGYWITDDQYDVKMEQNDIISVMETYEMSHLFIFQALLSELQNVHDCSAGKTTEEFNLETLRNGLRGVAKRFSLSDAIIPA